MYRPAGLARVYAGRVIPARGWLLGVVLLLVALSAGYLFCSGSVPLTPAEIFSAILGKGGEVASTVVWQLRLPRLLAALVAGSVLGGVGAVFQTLLRNPLAEPYVMGVSAGAGVGGTAVLATGLGMAAGGALTVAGGVAGGLAALAAVLALGGWFRHRDVVRLILAGVVAGSMLASLATVMLLLIGKDTNVVLRWLLGSLTPMYLERVALMAGFGLLALGYGWFKARELNAFAFGGELAGRLGVDTQKEVALHLALGTAAVGSVVGSAGIIGFVGLVAPHIARSLVGPDLRRMLGLSSAVGAVVLLVSDFVAQKAVPGTELPVGAVTAVLGSPVLLVLLRRNVYRV